MKIIKIDKDKEIYLKDNIDSITYNVYDKLVIYDYNFNTSKEVIINLLKDNSSIEYHYSAINKDNNTFKITINHLSSYTFSNVYNHVINVNDNNFTLDVTGVVPKKSYKCECNQDNQIINISNGKGVILPVLLIDNYDVLSSHSAYIGGFKEDSIYYLMSRGISRNKSIELLMKSFLINSGNNDEKEVKDYIKVLGDLNG